MVVCQFVEIAFEIWHKPCGTSIIVLFTTAHLSPGNSKDFWNEVQTALY